MARQRIFWFAAAAVFLLASTVQAQDYHAPITFDLDVEVAEGSEINRRIDTLGWKTKDWLDVWKDRAGRGVKVTFVAVRSPSVQGDPQTEMAGMLPMVANDGVPVPESSAYADPNGVLVRTAIFERVTMPGNFTQGAVEQRNPRLKLGVLTEGFKFRLGRLDTDGIEFSGTVSGVTQWATKVDTRSGLLLLKSKNFEGAGGMQIRFKDRSGATQEVNSACRIKIKVGAEKEPR